MLLGSSGGQDCAVSAVSGFLVDPRALVGAQIGITGLYLWTRCIDANFECFLTGEMEIFQLELPRHWLGRSMAKVTDAQSIALCGGSGEHSVLTAEGESTKHPLQKA